MDNDSPLVQPGHNGIADPDVGRRIVHGCNCDNVPILDEWGHTAAVGTKPERRALIQYCDGEVIKIQGGYLLVAHSTNSTTSRSGLKVKS